SPTEGERLLVELDGEVTTDEIEVVQPLLGPRDRYVTEVEVRLDGEDVGTFALDESSRRQGGQVLDIGEHTFSRFELVVRADNIGLRRKYEGLSPVGFAEVRVADVRVDEVLRLPSDLLDAAGDGSADHDLTVLLERQRGDAVFPGRTDEERSMVRAFSLPTARAFSLGGDARLSASLDDAEVDRLLGIPGEDEGGLTARSSSYLQGVLGSRASSALDGDRSTSWQTKFGEPAQVGAWIDVDVPTPVTFDRLDLSLVADGEHSVPTRLRIEGDGQLRTVEVPPVRDAREKGATRSVTVEFEPLTASRVRVVVEEVRPVRNIDYYSQLPVVRPIGVAELGIPGMTLPSSPEQFPDDCRDDLLEVDGRPVGLRLTGPAEDAAARSGLSVELCGTGEDELDLGAGDHLLRATQGEESGIDLDGLSLRSPASSPAPERGEAPDLVVLGAGRTSFDLAIAGATEPFWVVLGQSHSQGWTAEIEGGDSLGAPTVVNGFANGWYVDPQRQRDLRVSLEWTPQRGVWGALAASVAFALLCLGIVAWGWRRAGATYLAAGSGAGPVRAELASPLAYEHDRSGRSAVPAHPVLLALACGLVAALMVSPVVGAIVLAAVAGSLRWGRRRGRSVLSVGSVVAFAVAAGYVLARQAWKGGLEPNFEWPSYFGVSHVLAWVAILLLSADVVVELARRQARVQTDPEV
ncbi:MAG: discoidin domain-containing protein, partial [Actinomycetota bacterium]|nr:discoidin domain-containing protein [Actinomycetota bacterium]